MVDGQQSFKIFANTQIQWQKKRGKYWLWPRDVGRIADKLEELHTSMLLNHLRDEEEQNQPEEFPQGSERPIQKVTYQYLPNFKVVIIVMTTYTLYSDSSMIDHCWVTCGVLRCRLNPQRNYHLVMTGSLPWKITMLLIGKLSINRPFPMAMLNNQRVKPEWTNESSWINKPTCDIIS